jgi:hypothetical protein
MRVVTLKSRFKLEKNCELLFVTTITRIYDDWLNDRSILEFILLFVQEQNVDFRSYQSVE